MSGLEIITPPTKTVEFMGEQVAVSPVRIGHMQDFIAAALPVAQDIMEVLEGSQNLLTVVMLHGSRMIDMVTVGAQLQREKVADALPNEFIRLAGAVIEVNADFFARNLLPELKITIKGLQGAILQLKDGQT